MWRVRENYRTVSRNSSTHKIALYFPIFKPTSRQTLVHNGLLDTDVNATIIFIFSSQEELPINNKSDLWIGAWWICYIIAAVATLVVAIPIHLFPRFLPGTEVFRENRDAEMQNVASARNSIQTRWEIYKVLIILSSTVSLYPKTISKQLVNGYRSFTRRRSDFTFLMRNKPYVLITIGSAVNCALIFGFNTFGAKYMETVFGTTPFQASLIYGNSEADCDRLCRLFQLSGLKIDLRLKGISS